MSAGAIVVVSGLPRSGTSMLMGMLEAGGVPLLTDAQRAADASNPRGYFEYAPVKALKRDASWMPLAHGKAVKVVSHLLPWLPAGFDYRVLYLVRALDEVLASQAAMLRRQGLDAPACDAALRTALARDEERVRAWLTAQPHIATLDIAHRALLGSPAAAAAQIADFVGLRLDLERMTAAVEPALWRERGA